MHWWQGVSGRRMEAQINVAALMVGTSAENKDGDRRQGKMMLLLNLTQRCPGQRSI